jgi:hypothetical protein
MMSRYDHIFKLTLVLCLLMAGVFQQLRAQEMDTVTTLVEEPVTEVVDPADLPEDDRFPLFALDLVLDYGKLLTLPFDFETKFDGAVNVILFRRIVFAGEFGYGRLTPNNSFENFQSYRSEGTYYRIGLDYKMEFNPTTYYYLGARYAMSQFEDEGVFVVGSDLWNNFEGSFGTRHMNADWFEVIIGSESAMKNLKGAYLGFYFRVRIMRSYDRRSPIDVYSIPGYGRTFDRSIPAVNLYLRYRLIKG